MLGEVFRFSCGQHLTLRAVVDGEELRRSYSVCSGEDDGELRVAIRAVPGGRFSRWAVERLEEGGQVDVMPPEGRFGAAAAGAPGRHHVAFAAGSGITPVLSIARTVLGRDPQARFTLVYGNRQVSSTLFLEALEDLKDRHLGRFAMHLLFSREPQETPLLEGRLDGERVRQFDCTLLPVDTIDEAYLCGPAGMIDGVSSALAGLGLPAARIHAERFGEAGGQLPPARAPDHAALRAELLVEIDGSRRRVPFREGDASVLEAALRAGLDLPYACKGGMCCTCRGRVLEGEVRMARNYSLEPAEVAAGHVLTCQAVPLTPRLVVSFDER